jgi:hypothetical protein
MESESGAKIAIRGKGSVKEGKGRSDAAHTSNQEEDLHCLIMADTEEKVNKAKKLIHNVIETVSHIYAYCQDSTLTMYRPLPFLKARTNSSETSSVSLPRSTVRSATTRTKPARTVVKSVTASTTALRSRTSPQASSAVSVVKLVTWLAIVPTAKLDSRGATTTVLATVPRAALAALPRTSSMLSSRRWAVVADSLVELSNTTVVVLVATAMAAASATSSLGSGAQPAVLHPGRAATAAASVATATLALLHLGLRVVALVPVPVALTTRAEATATAALRLGHLLHQLLELLTATVTTELDTTLTLQRQAMALLDTVLLATAPLQQLPVLLLVWALFSRTTDLLEAHLLLRLRHLAQRLLRPRVMLHLHPRLAMLLLRLLPHSKCSRVLV